MPLDLGSIDGAHPTVRTALQQTQRYINQLEAKVLSFEKFGKGLDQLSPVQLQQIQQALSSTGSHPLNIQGLTGTPTVSP